MVIFLGKEFEAKRLDLSRLAGIPSLTGGELDQVATFLNHSGRLAALAEHLLETNPGDDLHQFILIKSRGSDVLEAIATLVDIIGKAIFQPYELALHYSLCVERAMGHGFSPSGEAVTIQGIVDTYFKIFQDTLSHRGIDEAIEPWCLVEHWIGTDQAARRKSYEDRSNSVLIASSMAGNVPMPAPREFGILHSGWRDSSDTVPPKEVETIRGEVVDVLGHRCELRGFDQFDDAVIEAIETLGMIRLESSDFSDWKDDIELLFQIAFKEYDRPPIISEEIEKQIFEQVYPLAHEQFRFHYCGLRGGEISGPDHSEIKEFFCGDDVILGDKEDSDLMVLQLLGLHGGGHVSG